MARIEPIHKGGSKSLTENYRRRSLLDTGYKVLTNILAERISESMEKEKLKESQGGFTN